MIIAGVDPGLTTGVALLAWNGTDFPEPPALETHQVEFEHIVPFMWDLVHRVDMIAMERFQISKRTITSSRQPETLEVIYGTKFVCTLREVFYREQNVSDAKNAYTNLSLGALGWHVKGKHARDAMRHALLATHRRSLYQEVQAFYGRTITPDTDEVADDADSDG